MKIKLSEILKDAKTVAIAGHIRRMATVSAPVSDFIFT